MRAIILAVFLLLPAAAHAQASDRMVALIIANGSYAAAGMLTNPANDARLVGDAAQRAGFEVVSTQNADLASFQRALRDFRIKADGARVAMVYYAGHGIEGSGKNWLIPVDARLESSLDLPYEAIELDRVMDSMSGAQVRMVVLDACRNNPFGRSWKSATRAVQRGLAGIEFDNVLVIYAAAPGQTASDGDNANSPFATSLAKRLVEPDLPIQLLGGTIRDDVLAATGGGQRPYTTGSITGTPIYLVTSVARAMAAGPADDSEDQADLRTRWFAVVSEGDTIKMGRMLDSGEVTIKTPVDDQANTALHVVAERCDNEAVRFLLKRGADPLRKNGYNDSPLRIAQVRCPPPSTTAQILAKAAAP